MISLNVGLSLTILTLFFIVIMIGYVYVDETKKNSKEAKDAIIVVNKTQTKFLEEWSHKQEVDNVRYNKTLTELAKTYDLIVDNQKLIINLTNFGSQNSQANLNLTKFNHASLVDTNNVIHELAEQLNITVPEFNASRIG